jgi:hypothetical protein
MSEFKIQQATRRGISPLIVAYSESGCGKTYSSLLLARGLAGPKGKIVVADSESGRASLYADVLPDGFETFDLCAPFTPARYVEAIDTIETSGAAVGIIDSGSHEWDGPGSVLDMATEIEAKSGKTGLHCWRQPKFEHAKFVQRLQRTKIPFIVCLRAKYKSRQTKENGKTVILKDDKTSPIQADDFIFEATCHFEILQNHSIILTKCSHPSLRDCFPKDKTTPITVHHGELLGAWCNQAGQPATIASGSVPSTSPSNQNAPTGMQGVKSDAKTLKELEIELWTVLKPVRTPGVKTWDKANEWLWREEILDAAKEPAERAPDLTTERFREVIAKAREVLTSKR